MGDALLGQVDDRFYYAVSCNGCGRHKRLSLVALRAKLGDAFPLVEVRGRLKCSTCGSKALISAYYPPSMIDTAGFGELFREPFA